MAIIKNLPASKSLEKQLEYLEQEGKTLDGLKKGINCTNDNVLKEFYIVKDMYNKSRGKEYYHLVQSFSPQDNIIPEKANEIGISWIGECIRNHQIYVVTHIDKEHIHNHFIVNSVNMENGRKLQITPQKLYNMKKISNEICLKNNMQVIDLDNKNKMYYKSDNEYYMERRLINKNIKTWKQNIKNAINISIRHSSSYAEFRNMLLDNFNIEIYETREKLDFKDNNINKSVCNRRLGKEYGKVDIINRLYNNKKINKI